MSTATLDFTVTHVKAETFAYVVRRVAAEETGEFVGEGLGQVGRFAADHGGAAGPPMSVCSAPDETGSFVVEVGFPVADGTPPEAPVEVRTLPATVAIVCSHVGPYEELGARYAQLFSQANDEGFTPTCAPRERYLGFTDDGEPITQILWPIG